MRKPIIIFCLFISFSILLKGNTEKSVLSNELELRFLHLIPGKIETDDKGTFIMLELHFAIVSKGNFIKVAFPSNSLLSGNFLTSEQYYLFAEEILFKLSLHQVTLSKEPFKFHINIGLPIQKNKMDYKLNFNMALVRGHEANSVQDYFKVLTKKKNNRVDVLTCVVSNKK